MSRKITLSHSVFDIGPQRIVDPFYMIDNSLSHMRLLTCWEAKRHILAPASSSPPPDHKGGWLGEHRKLVCTFNIIILWGRVGRAVSMTWSFCIPVQLELVVAVSRRVTRSLTRQR